MIEGWREHATLLTGVMICSLADSSSRASSIFGRPEDASGKLGVTHLPLFFPTQYLPSGEQEAQGKD